MEIGAKFNDHEAKRSNRNQSDRQIKNYHQTKEAVIVNNIVKDNISYNRNDLLHDYIIPSNSKMPKDQLQFKPVDKDNNRSLKLLCATALGVLGSVAGVASLASSIAKKKIKKPTWESLPDIGRNMNLNKDSHFVTYMAVQNPQSKTVLGAAAFFTFAATAFVMKNFVDGFKDTWVKKQNADTDYKLQDNLINVETNIFKGKNEIIRTMMQDTAFKMQKMIEGKDKPNSNTFEGFLQFKGNKEQVAPEKEDNKKSNTTNVLMALGTLGASALLGRVAFKNIKKTGELIKKNHDDTHKQVKEILDKAPDEILEKHKDTLKDLFSILNFKPKEVKEKLTKAKLPEEEINKVVDEVEKRTGRFTQAPKEVGGHVGKIQYFTFIEDASGHFYNWMMNMDSKPLGILAMAMTGVGAAGYVGEKTVEGVREVEVKKVNNETELAYHKKLVNVELRNFNKKKESYIQPLLGEFKKQVPNKNKDELQDMAQNVLYEIKNGPPFVYS